MVHYFHANHVNQCDSLLTFTPPLFQASAIETLPVRGTHHSRKSQPMADAANKSIDSTSQQLQGNWACSLYQQVYNKINNGEAVAKMSGFMTRAEYYLPRADIMPSDFYHLESRGGMCAYVTLGGVLSNGLTILETLF